MLTVEDLAAGYGDSIAVSNVSLHVDEGEAVAVIGSNGAGKTTLLRAICGLLPTRSGTVTYGGDRLTGTPAHRIARRGVAYVPAERHLFGGMSVHENLELGAYPEKPDAARMDMVFELFPRLADRRSQHAGTMSGGEQQMLAVGRALMANPELILMDEPSEGLAPRLVQHVDEIMQRLKAGQQSVLLVEQNLALAMAVADEIHVLSSGRFVFHGTPAELAAASDVLDQHLGVAATRLA
jgi:branched-chain amino acid transport system ATP-binding protein